MAGTPDIFGQKASYDAETSNNYDKEANKEYNKALAEGKLDETTLLADMYYKKIYEDPSVTKSAFSFLHTEHYDGTNFNDMTDTYVNMNTSFRYIKFNIDGAGDTYNKLATNLDYKKDSPQKVFDFIIQKLKSLGYDKIYKNGKREANSFASDIDFMYAIGLFQALVEKSNAGVSNLSKKDFRVGPKTLASLLQTTNPLAIAVVNTNQDKPSNVVDNKNPEIATTTLDDAIKSTNEELKNIDPQTNSEDYQKKMDDISLLEEKKKNIITSMPIKKQLPEQTLQQDKIATPESENAFGFYLTLKTVKNIDKRFEDAAKDKVKELLKDENYKDFIANMRKIFYTHLDVSTFDKLSPTDANTKIFDVYKELSTGANLLNRLGFWLVLKEIEDENESLPYNPKFTNAITSAEWQDAFENASGKIIIKGKPGITGQTSVYETIKEDPGYSASKKPVEGFDDVIKLYGLSLDKIWENRK